MKQGSAMSVELERAVEGVVRDLVRGQRINGAFYVNLPLLYPDGSFVTVRIDQVPKGLRVSDAGFAYHQIDDIGAAKSFRRTANKAAELNDVTVGDRALYTEADADSLHRAILDVADASWRVADQVCQRVFDEDDQELVEALNERLVKLFGSENVAPEQSITGASTNEWEMSAVVSYRGRKTVFQAVSNANSVYRTSTAFRDIAGLDNPPRLVAVVRDMKALGPRKALLAPGRVIEEAQPDDLFRKAAA